MKSIDIKLFCICPQFCPKVEDLTSHSEKISKIMEFKAKNY